MKENLPKIFFYLPQLDHIPNDIFQNNLYYYTKYNTKVMPRPAFTWIYRTYQYLKCNNYPCELVGRMPREGIVLFYRDSLSDDLHNKSIISLNAIKPDRNLFLICAKTDKRRHPYAPLHVIQSRMDPITRGFPALWKSYYIPIWPQLDIIPRDRRRGTKFKNIAYAGLRRNLSDEITNASFQELLKKAGFNFYFLDRDRWNDYSFVDAVLAVRSLDGRLHANKPASKLFNAWRAGVPAIISPEASCRVERKSELDYIEINSLEEIMGALKRLREDEALRHKMVDNGWIRAQEITSERITERWENFLTTVAIPAYDKWRRTSSLNRKIFFICRYLDYKKEGLKIRVSRKFSNAIRHTKK